jgi:predicted component of type VI protein secretion system
MERAPLLVCVEGTLSGQQYRITTDGLRLGREASNEVVIVDNGVSRQHARVIVHNGAVWVQDAGSRNGVFVNGKRVQDYKSLNVGDRVKVGESVFEVSMSGPGGAAAPQPRSAPPPVPVAAAPVPTETPAPYPERVGPRWRVWPFALAGSLVVILISLVALRGGPSPAPIAPVQPSYSLAAVVEGGPPPAAAPGTPGTPTPSVAEALASGAGAAGPRVPPPPAGATVESLKEKAQGLMDADRLADARIAYLQALQLDAACELCRKRADTLGADIQARATERLDAGVRALDSMQYQQAATSLEMVLLLVPDTADPLHVRAQEALKKAKAGGR